VLLCVHAGVGALVGRRLPGRAAAVLLGVGAHAALDAIRHDDNGGADPAAVVGLACLADALLAAFGIAALGLLGGWGSRATLGAISGALPDLELALPWNRRSLRGSRFLFPSHAVARLHSCLSPVAVPLRVQAALAAFVWVLALTAEGPGRAEP